MNIDKLISFVEPYYKDKDIMHNMWHMKMVKRQIDKILQLGKFDINYDDLIYAMYFHGFVYSHENEIREFLNDLNFDKPRIEKIIKISWESQRNEIPETLEGKILHDAHVLEGGKSYLVVKTLITGSIRGQSLEQTLKYMSENVLNKNKCYLEESKPLCDEMNEFTNDFYKELNEGIKYD